MSPGTAKLAIVRQPSTVSRTKKPSTAAKSLAGNALSQSKVSKLSSVHVARIAAKVLASPTSKPSAKLTAAGALSKGAAPFPVKTYRIAGSVLTQKKSAEIVRKVATKTK